MLHLHRTRLQIEKFVYQKGTNVALYNAEHAEEYQVFQEKLQKALLAQIKRIADYKEKLPLLMSLAKAQATTAELLAQVSALISIDPLVDKVDLKAYLIWAGTQGGQAFFDKTDLDVIFGLKDQELIAYFGDYSRLVIDGIDDTTKKWIAGTIQSGKSMGKTPFEIQQMLIEEGTAMSKIRAERIVLTETAKAMTTIELEAARRNGIMEKVWRTSLDERVCPICEPMDGTIIGIDNGFQAKRNSNGTIVTTVVDGPPAHVRCRCYIDHVIPNNWQIPDKIWIGM